MFDLGASELLIVVVVAILVIGPKDMPLALRAAGRWIGKVRRVSAHFRTGIDAMVREAEMEDMESEWKKRNAQIMAETPAGEMQPLPEQYEPEHHAGAEARALSQEEDKEGAAGAPGAPDVPDIGAGPDKIADKGNEPQLPFAKGRPPRGDG